MEKVGSVVEALQCDGASFKKRNNIECKKLLLKIELEFYIRSDCEVGIWE
jgi:hypothetical protein